MVEIDSPAPAFTLDDQHGHPTGPVDPTDGRRGTLLVFFPYAFSGVCGDELTILRDRQTEFAAEDVRLVGISTDPVYALRAFADALGLYFPLLSDFWPHGAIARRYGVFHDERGCPLRGTFLVDADGVVRWKVVNGLAEPRDTEAYLRAVRALASAPAHRR